MSNGVFAPTKQVILTGGLNLDTADLRAILIDTAAYTVNLATHDFLADVPGGARISVSPTIGNTTVVGGTLDGDDVTFSAVTGATCEALIIYVHTGSDATARLVAYIDTGVVGLPVTPSGADIILRWNASGIVIWNDA